jgi:hypothetical protein
MGTTPVFIATPKTWLGQVSAANTNRDGSGTVVDIVTAGANGSRIDNIEITAAGTVTAGVVRLYLNDGTNTRLFKEAMVTATTPSTSVEVFRAALCLAEGLVLPSGWKLKASTHNAETFNVFARGGDF